MAKSMPVNAAPLVTSSRVPAVTSHLPMQARSS